MLKGLGVSSGIAQGTAFVLDCADRVLVRRALADGDAVAREVERLRAAVARAEAELAELERLVGARAGARQGEIFAAQALVLRGSLVVEATALIHEQRLNAEAALTDVLERLVRAFDGLPDAYLRERGADVRDVGRRVLGLLDDAPDAAPLPLPAAAIIVAEELLPSTAARLELEAVRGFVTERGARSAHASILARSIGTPAVTALPGAARQIRSGDHVIVDGTAGIVFVNPAADIVREYDRLEGELGAYRAELRQLAELPSLTSDGVPVPLLANVSKFADTEAAYLYRADGIGLYRTEFGYFIRNGFPTEEQQYEYVKRAAARFHPRPVTFRLLDLGGDKELPYFKLPPARNPSLAPRGLGLLLRHPEILRPQLRALLRVAAEHPAAILLPVVTSVDDVRAARAVLGEVRRELEADGLRFLASTPLGAMIEVPAAALIVDALAREVDFFSLGTNDLVQYLLAADREDQAATSAYQPLHPAALRLIQATAAAARRAERPLTICGEMAGNPAYTELLLGLGLRRFSVGPGELAEVKRAIRGARLAAATALAEAALALGTTAEVEALLAARAAGQLPIG